MKKMLCMLLTFIMAMSMTVTAYAAEPKAVADDIGSAIWVRAEDGTIITADGSGEETVIGYTIDGQDYSVEEYKQYQEKRLGLPISIAATENGKKILLGSYTFEEEEGTTIAPLMSKLESWWAEGNNYQQTFFSQDWAYKTVKGNKSIAELNLTDKTVTFTVRESVEEIDYSVLLRTLRTAVRYSERELTAN